MSIEIRDCMFGKGLFLTTVCKANDVLWTIFAQNMFVFDGSYGLYVQISANLL